jgi:hypothetical protein
MSAASNHPAVQNAKDTVVNGEVSAANLLPSLEMVANMVARHRLPMKFPVDLVLNLAGPVGQNVQAEASKTRNEFADLANSRQTPDYKAATGQNLTRM